ncbi:DUF362 domain-containing protein [Candidatus Bathyarchaeota archaeon]|nr:DUF362 domain-containing protein [Candidatus Bathyarchaeota archaeon]
MSKVAIVKGTDPKLITRQALDLVEAEKIVRHRECVLVKPNCVFPKDPSTGVTTDSRVVEVIVELLRDNGVQDVVIGDGGNRNTDKTFDMIGMRDVAARYGAKLVNFNDDEGVDVEIPSAIALHKVAIAKTILDSSFIINVPKLKIHHMAQVTLSIKNLMGTIVGDRGAIMHRQIDEKLADLANYIKPGLNVIDGIVGCEMDEVKGEPISMNLVIAGTDMVATDAVGAAVMGVDPRMVRHLQLAEKRGLGTARLDAISIVGESIESVRKDFRTCFSKGKLREYGFDHYVSDEVLRPLFENVGRNLPKTQRQD